MKLTKLLVVLGITTILSGCSGSPVATSTTSVMGPYGGSPEPTEQATERGEILRRRSGKNRKEFSGKSVEAISRASMQDAMRNADAEESESMDRLQKQAIWACDRIAVEEILGEGETRNEICRLIDKGWGLKDADAIMALREESGMSETDAEKTIRDFVRDKGLKPSWIEE